MGLDMKCLASCSSFDGTEYSALDLFRRNIKISDSTSESITGLKKERIRVIPRGQVVRKVAI